MEKIYNTNKIGQNDGRKQGAGKSGRIRFADASFLFDIYLIAISTLPALAYSSSQLI